MSDIEWIRSFPDHLTQDNICLVHDRPRDRFMPESWRNPAIEDKYQEWFFHSPGFSPATPESDWEDLWEFMNGQNLQLILCGHTHIPFYRKYGDKRLYNTGSVGMPLDGDPRPSWVLGSLSPDGSFNFEIRRVEYDINKILELIDGSPDYPDFKDPDFKEAYMQGMKTGLHWSAHIKKDK